MWIFGDCIDIFLPFAVDDQTPELSEEKVLEMIESSYPNPITVQEMAKWVLSGSYVQDS